MQYIVKKTGGDVEIVTVFPRAVVRLSDNLEIPIVGQRRTATECIIYGGTEEEPFYLTVGDAEYNIADLKEDTVSGYKIIFHDIEKDVVKKWVPEKQPTVLSWRTIEPVDVPSDRYFRNAWEDDNGIVVNMPKARVIHKDKLRRLRTPILEKLDEEYLRADEAGDTQKKKDIAAKKQLLRDVTAVPEIEAAQTPEELKAVVPDVLK